MPQPLSRRNFCRVASMSAAAAAAAGFTALGIEPFQRSEKPRLRLGLAAYSFREYFKDSAHPQERAVSADRKIDLFQFLDYCANHGVQGAELTSYYFPAEVTPEFLLKVKRHAFLRGVELSGTAVGNTFTHPKGEKRAKEIALVKRWIDHAALMGMPHVRVFAGNANGQSLEQAKRNCIEALEECLAHAASKGVFLGIENHGGIVAEAGPLLEILKAVDSPWLGINLDTANFHTDDPYADLQKCAPYAVNVQIKSEFSPRGQNKQPADLGRLVKILKDAKYQGYLTLEYEAVEDPYKAVPGLLQNLRELI